MLTQRSNGSNSPARFPLDLDRLFSEFPGFSVPVRAAATGPALNVWENEQSVHVELEVPGFAMDDIEVLFMGDELTIRGRREDTFEENAQIHRRERRMTEFSRVMRLPMPIDADNVNAELANGLLHVTLPKAEIARPRKIEVRTK